jgi:hypothetical protein
LWVKIKCGGVGVAFFVMFSLSTANINEKWEIVDFAAKKLKK